LFFGGFPPVIKRGVLENLFQLYASTASLGISQLAMIDDTFL
jgi:hypothetical protein